MFLFEWAENYFVWKSAWIKHFFSRCRFQRQPRVSTLCLRIFERTLDEEVTSYEKSSTWFNFEVIFETFHNKNTSSVEILNKFWRIFFLKNFLCAKGFYFSIVDARDSSISSITVSEVFSKVWDPKPILSFFYPRFNNKKFLQTKWICAANN